MKFSVNMPSMGESILEGTILSLAAKEGTYINEGDVLVVVESEKASLEVPSPKSGAVHYVVKEEDNVKVGQLIAEIDTDAVQKKKKEGSTGKKKVDLDRTTNSPSEKEKDLKKGLLSGSSSGSNSIRKTKDDYLKEILSAKRDRVDSDNSEKSQKIRKKMSNIRFVVAKRLVKVKNETAMLTTFNELDMSRVMELRSRNKERFQKEYGVKLTYLTFFAKACGELMQEFVDLNSFIDGSDIIVNQSVNLGIAVSTPRGLVVPVIREVENLTCVEISRKISELAKKARDSKIGIRDISDGTFTITNGGVFGSMLSTPILNPPQSAILGMHNIVDRAVVVDKEIKIAPIMYLALSYDHRIVDGKEAVGFLLKVKQFLENFEESRL